MIRFDCRLRREAFTLDAAFEAPHGITALFGASGSGKSTIIRLLAGLEQPQHGRIEVEGTLLLDTQKRIAVPPHKRRIGLVFQDALLFPHLSVRANLTYGRFFTPAKARRVEFDAVVTVLGIGHLLGRRPDTLSGGERQRVAIGRALLTSPRLLLLDEPLAALDQARKLEILPFIERLRDEFGIPIIYVSHAVEEVARLASHVVRLEAGKVVATGSPADILSGPGPAGVMEPSANRFDRVSILSAPVQSYLPDYGVTVLDHPAGAIVVPGQVVAQAEARVMIRASHVVLARDAPGNLSVRTVLKGQVLAIATDSGPFALVSLALAGGDILQAYTTRLAVDALGIAVGDRIQALIKGVTIEEGGIAGLRSP